MQTFAFLKKCSKNNTEERVLFTWIWLKKENSLCNMEEITEQNCSLVSKSPLQTSFGEIKGKESKYA